MTGLVKVLRDLEGLKSEVTPGQGGKADELLKKTALFTRNYVDSEYYRAKVENADSITVDDEINGDTATITASGEKILFVEFGTGINKNYDSPSHVAGEYGFSPASWSMQNSQWLLPPKSIVFKGLWPIPGTFGSYFGTKSSIWTEGDPPVDAMYKAFEALKSNYPTFAKDIFK